MKDTGLRPDELDNYDPANPYYTNRDPRFYLTIAKNGDEKWPNWNTVPLQTYQGGLNAEPLSGGTPTAVSYTHLDVYKRQIHGKWYGK